MAQGVTPRTGTAGWSLPRDVQAQFGGLDPRGTHLQRYATRLNAAEINSSFYRPHGAGTYMRWAASVPDGFSFSVKLPKAITHEHRLADCSALLDAFLAQALGLGDKLGCLIAQLPPSLTFEPRVAASFCKSLRERWGGNVALEPRHASWFTPDASALLAQARIARVLADPVLHDAGRWPGGWDQLIYLRLHGSPRTYYSAYQQPLIEALADRIKLAADPATQVWCIFDNTASGAAAHNALALSRALGDH